MLHTLIHVSWPWSSSELNVSLMPFVFTLHYNSGSYCFCTKSIVSALTYAGISRIRNEQGVTHFASTVAFSWSLNGASTGAVYITLCNTIYFHHWYHRVTLILYGVMQLFMSESDICILWCDWVRFWQWRFWASRLGRPCSSWTFQW